MAEKTLSTRLCDLLDIKYPIILTGMGTVAGAELVQPLPRLADSASSVL